jgi:hypothetical protein
MGASASTRRPARRQKAGVSRRSAAAVEPPDAGDQDAAVAAVKRRLLALAWMMPPLVYPRALQVSRTFKALSARGWKITVVTILPDAEPSGLLDHELGKYYDGCYRSLTVDPRETGLPSPGWLRLSRWLRRRVDIVGDNWKRRSGDVLRREIALGNHDVLVTIGQPWINHLVGLRVKRRFPSLPWLAQFSDPWVDSPYQRFANRGDEARAGREERRVIENADAIVFVTRRMADLVMTKYPAALGSKVSIVSHGYDDKLLGLIPSVPETRGKCRIVHTGSFYPGKREPLAFLDAVAEIAREGGIGGQLEVVFVGHASEGLIARTRQLGLEGIVGFRGRSLYVDSLAAANSADLLLLLDAPAENSVFLPSKLADYLMVRKPILGLTPLNGASAEVLGRLGCPVIAPGDTPAIAAWLRAACARWRAGEPVAPLPDVARSRDFEISRVAGDFERALEQAICRTDVLHPLEAVWS